MLARCLGNQRADAAAMFDVSVCLCLCVVSSLSLSFIKHAYEHIHEQPHIAHRNACCTAAPQHNHKYRFVMLYIKW